mgnify:CR=1 FL=1
MKKLLPVLLLIAITSTSFQPRLLPTTLKITVIDHLGNVVKGAEVSIYRTEDNYRDNTNPVQEKKITDEKGRVTFKKLAPVSYFIDARKGDANNDGEGVRTGKLKEGKVNRVNTVIE